MRPRKNVANLTAAERQAFVAAMIGVRSKPSQRGLANRYDDYVRIHTDAMNVLPISWGHGGPAFTAWHRVLLYKFEQELRAIDDTVRVPFWDWTVDRTPTSPPWLADFLGGDGGPTNPAGSASGEVTNGEFRHSAGNWNITTGDPGTNDDSFDRPYLARGFARRSDAGQLPTSAQQTTALGRGLYSLFRYDLEVPLHNLVHRWVNGQMYYRASPMEPVFWMHHANIDRVWGIWMRGRPDAERYTAAATDPSFHQPTGTMIFHDPSVGPATPTWSGSYRPIDTIADHAFGVWYEGDPPVITLETPSVTFNDVELGRTTYAAIVFRVEAIDTIGFEVLSTVPAPFGLPPSLYPPAPVVPDDTAQPGRVWLSFTASALGPVAPITVSVRCIQTGMSYNVTVSANVVPVKTAAAAFVADRSGSMAGDAGNGFTKRHKLGQALGIVAGLARDVDQLALVSFDDVTDVVMPIGDALAAGGGGTRDQLAAAATSADLDPRGLTGIGAGIQVGSGQLSGSTADTVALVVITDGIENIPPFIADVAGVINSRTYAIGIGQPSSVNTAALDGICQGNEGYLLVTGDLASEELFRLHKYFLQIHAGVTNNQIVTDPAGELTVGAVHEIPLWLTEADISADVIVLSPLADVLRLEVQAPDGAVFDAGSGLPTIEVLDAPWLTGLRLTLPVQPGAGGGRWLARLTIDRSRLADRRPVDGGLVGPRERGTLPYSLAVAARSDLNLRANVRRKEDQARLIATLDAHGIPFWDRATVIALVTDPYGRTDKVVLDDESNGRYRTMLNVAEPGLYAVRVMAEGEINGQPFTREQVLTVPTVTGKPDEEAIAVDEVRRKERQRPKDYRLNKVLRTARPPLPLPEPEVIAEDAIARHLHGKHGDNHFPSEDQVAAPEPWEPWAEAENKPKKKPPKKKPGGGHDH
jgi:hypothetical protein